jgi:hypothetical protein
MCLIVYLNQNLFHIYCRSKPEDRNLVGIESSHPTTSSLTVSTSGLVSTDPNSSLPINPYIAQIKFSAGTLPDPVVGKII